MTTRSIGMPFILSIILTLVSNCLPQAQDNLHEALRLYRENKLDKSLPYFEREIERDPCSLRRTRRRMNGIEIFPFFDHPTAWSALRLSMSKAEVVLWKELSHKKMHRYKFRRCKNENVWCVYSIRKMEFQVE